MIIAIMSDLHIEYDRRGRRHEMPDRPRGHPQCGPSLLGLAGRVDLLLLAGDIDVGVEAVRYGASAAAYLDCRVIMIAGNHEFYNAEYDDMLARLRKEASAQDAVDFLEDDVIELNVGDRRLRIAGSTLWTDYELLGSDPLVVASAMASAGKSLTDHFVITTAARGAGGADTRNEFFMPDDARQLHIRSRRWLTSVLAKPFDGTTLIMTHHGISNRSVPQRFKDDALSPCFVSEMSEMVAGSGAALWVHGHTHGDVDYVLGSTRVIARQRGYPGERSQFEPFVLEF